MPSSVGGFLRQQPGLAVCDPYSYYIILYYIILYCIILYNIILYYIILYSTLNYVIADYIYIYIYVYIAVCVVNPLILAMCNPMSIVIVLAIGPCFDRVFFILAIETDVNLIQAMKTDFGFYHLGYLCNLYSYSLRTRNDLAWMIV